MLRPFSEYEFDAWETTSVRSERSRATSQASNGQTPRVLPQQRYGSRAPSVQSSAGLPPGADYWRDASPLGVNHSSRNLRELGSNPSLQSNLYAHGLGASRVQSMAGMSMWGSGSNYDPGMIRPMMTGPYHHGGQSFDSPMSEHMSLRPPTLYPPYVHPAMMGLGAPMNSMSGLAGYGNLDVQDRMSTFSLATTANPLASAAPLMPNGDPNPSDEEVLSVLRRYLASEDLMSVYVHSSFEPWR